jgi:hypothetical protein
MAEEDLITITNRDNTINSLDVIARMDQTDNPEEYDQLSALAEQGEASEDWEHGEVLIRDDYFQTYAIDLAESLDTLPTAWPLNCIDWDRAADLLQEDYTALEFDGVRYWIR